MPGYVYLLINASLPGLVKIGRTSRDPFAGASELRTTGVPTPFEVLAAVQVAQPDLTEQRLHARLAEVSAAGGGSGPPPAAPQDTFEAAQACFGEGLGYNPVAGRAMLERLAKRKHPEACLALGHLVLEERRGDFNQRMKRAEKFVQVAAEAELPGAFYLLACWHRDARYADAWLRRLEEPQRLEAALIIARQGVKPHSHAPAQPLPYPLVFAENSYLALHGRIFEALEQDLKQLSTLPASTAPPDLARSLAAIHDRDLVKLTANTSRLHALRKLGHYTEFIEEQAQARRIEKDLPIPPFAAAVLREIRATFRFIQERDERADPLWSNYRREVSWPGLRPAEATAT